MEPTTAPTPAQIAEQIAAWKTQHGDVKAISVTIAEGDVATAYLKPADRNVVAFGLTRMMKNQVVEAGEFVLKNCFLGGDSRLQLTGPAAQTKAQITAAIASASLLEMYEVEVKNE